MAILSPRVGWLGILLNFLLQIRPSLYDRMLIDLRKNPYFQSTTVQPLRKNVFQQNSIRPSTQGVAISILRSIFFFATDIITFLVNHGEMSKCSRSWVNHTTHVVQLYDP